MSKSRYKPPNSIKPEPSLTSVATMVLKELSVGKEVYEIGCGGSTLWFSQFVKRIVGIEDDEDWYNTLKPLLGKNVFLRLVKTKDMPASIIGMWDVVFVDCLTQDERVKTIFEATKHVRPGGWLVADDYIFPKVRKAIDTLGKRGWDVHIVVGYKIHTARKERVRTSTAFCGHPVEEGTNG